MNIPTARNPRIWIPSSWSCNRSLACVLLVTRINQLPTLNVLPTNQTCKPPNSSLSNLGRKYQKASSSSSSAGSGSMAPGFAPPALCSVVICLTCLTLCAANALGSSVPSSQIQNIYYKDLLQVGTKEWPVTYHSSTENPLGICC
jgi:hypothetical protein